VAGGGGDTVPAMLTPGEMVLNRQQQNMLGGQGLLARLFGYSRAVGLPAIRITSTRIADYAVHWSSKLTRFVA